MTLPLIPTPSCCGTAGWTPCPTDGSHNHDDLYYRKAESDCNSVAAFGEIIGTPDPSLCVDCDVLAGAAISTDPMAWPILEITEYTDPGSVPYAAPAVTALTVDGDKVTVEWGPSNNDASIPLQLIADAIAANPQAAALMRIAVCDCSSFSSFTSGEIELTVPLKSSHDDSLTLDSLVILREGLMSAKLSESQLELVDETSQNSVTFRASDNSLTSFWSLYAPDAQGTVSLDAVVAKISPSTGFSADIYRWVDSTLCLTPAGTLATGSIDFPTAEDSRVGQIVRIVSTETVTALTMIVTGGGTILNNITTLDANVPYAFQCVEISGTSTWIRIQ